MRSRLSRVMTGVVAETSRLMCQSRGALRRGAMLARRLLRHPRRTRVSGSKNLVLSKGWMTWRVYPRPHLERNPQLQRLSAAAREAMLSVSAVLSFRVDHESSTSVPAARDPAQVRETVLCCQAASQTCHVDDAGQASRGWDDRVLRGGILRPEVPSGAEAGMSRRDPRRALRSEGQRARRLTRFAPFGLPIQPARLTE